MNRLLPALLALATLPATAQIDPTFGIDSTYTWPGLGFGDAPAINDLLVHPDGRIWLIIEDNNKAIVHGLDGDGLLDAGFATAGIYQRAGTALQDYQRAMLAPDNSEVYVMGTLKGLTGDPTIGVDRFNANGGLTTWHGSGYRTFNISNCDGTRGYAMLLRSDGRLLLAGRCDEGFAFSALAVVALQTTGNNDNTFGTNGQYVVQLNASSEIVRDLVMDASGGFVLANSTAEGGVSMRLSASGVLSNSWNGDGSSGTSTPMTRVLRLDDNKLLFLGYNQLARLMPDGSDDPNYGVAGVLTPDHPDGDLVFRDMIADAQGRALVAGYLQIGFAPHPMVMRLLPTGEVDASFGTNGFVVAPWTNTFGSMVSVAVDAQERILLGFTASVSGTYSGRVCRIYTDGTTGTADRAPSAEFLRAWPNPASDELYVQHLEAGTTVHVIDALGRGVPCVTHQQQGQVRVDIGALQAGSYTVRAGGRSAHFVKR